jgi:uncharacterized protein YjiS (DUF1127 family)
MTSLITHACPTAPVTRPSGNPMKRIFDHAFAVWRSRRALSQLTPAQLEDVGVTREQAADEVRRPVWDVPANWRD